MTEKIIVDAVTRQAARTFLARIASRYDVAEAVLFGSRARGTHTSHSDVDLALILRGPQGDRVDVGLVLSGIAFDVMLDTNMLVQALPLWEDEWANPIRFENPALIANIKRDGIRLIETKGVEAFNKELAMDTSVVTSDPDILGGTPVFTGTRVPIAMLFENLAGGLSLDEILDSYPSISRVQAIEALHQAELLLEKQLAGISC